MFTILKVQTDGTTANIDVHNFEGTNRQKKDTERADTKWNPNACPEELKVKDKLASIHVKP